MDGSGSINCNSRGGQLTRLECTIQEQLASAISEKIHSRGGQVILDQ